jgi:hypothetical protein
VTGRRKALRSAPAELARLFVAELGPVEVCLLEVVAEDLIELDELQAVLG